MNPKRLVRALDYTDPYDLSKALETDCAGFKIGPVALLSIGLPAIEALRKWTHPVKMLDLKLYDTPKTIERTVREAVKLGFNWITVAAAEDMLGPALNAADGEINIAAVTVLTSRGAPMEIRPKYDPGFVAMERALLARAMRCQGVICPPWRAREIREDTDLIVFCPGIREKGEEKGGHASTMTAEEALAAGADYIIRSL